MPGAPGKRTAELLRKVFEVLLQFPEGLQAKDVLQSVATACPPTDFEKSTLPSGTGRFDKIIRFATIPSVKAGWLIKDKGRWTVTEQGKAALEKFKNPEAFSKEARNLFNEWMAQRAEVPPDSAEGTAEVTDTLSEAPDTLDDIEEQAWSGIQKYLEKIEPYEFQRLVAALLKAMGYNFVSAARPGADRGVDIMAYKDPLGASGPRVKVQVKRRPNTKSDADDLRAFVGLLTDDDIGVFVSTGGFTTSAESEARAQHSKRLTLLDLEQLVELWTKYYVS